ncbi:hypothetical protein PLANPX_1605 [Lacipirellula parvula]|uniref:Uncharacterized protein n=1 Tax=Lacipirellula parvula TaxID=2650471 RepID=A0A5K7XCE7_9BACT|nr:hypothetical protein PLANPX_1605 [Lacipirellula parvula]
MLTRNSDSTARLKARVTQDGEPGNRNGNLPFNSRGESLERGCNK